jgi:predicted peptidase
VISLIEKMNGDATAVVAPQWSSIIEQGEQMNQKESRHNITIRMILLVPLVPRK